MKRVLLDESLPRQIGDVLAGYTVETVARAGWAGLKNGELLKAAAGRFDVLLSADQGIAHQQNLADVQLGIVALAGRTNKLEDLLPLIAQAREAIDRVEPGEVIEIRWR